MKYCWSCGNAMEDEDSYCSKCGKPVEGVRPTPSAATREKEPANKLCCELAYFGFLFWLPLAFCKKDKYAVRSANQGLWVLITAVVCCTAIRILGAVNTFFSGHLIGVLTGGIYTLAFIVFISFMLYLMWRCLRNVLNIHSDREMEPVLFFDNIAFFR